MPEPEGNPVFVPVTAEDFARRRRRVVTAWVGGAVVIAAAAGFVYKRSVDPIHAQESYDAGQRLFETARYSQAILSFDRAIDLRPDFADAYYLRARARVAEDDADHALQDFAKLIQLQPRNPRGFLGRGAVHFDLNNFAGAIADCTSAVGLDPKLAAAYNLRGMALRSAGDPRKALEDFNRAVELAPDADNYYQRASTYQVLGEHRLALRDLDQVIGFLPDQAQGYFARAESRRSIGDLAGAKADHQRGMDLDSR